MNEIKQPGKLYLDEYKNALTGEIRDLIGHCPDDAELALMEQYAADYVAECLNAHKLPTLAGLACALLDCRNGEFKQCAECSDWFLCNKIDDWGYCDAIDCQIAKRKEQEFDPRREWGTY